MADHTKAPWAWQAESKNLAYLVEADDATIIARLSAEDVSNNFSRVAANTCRIVACVNACEGIETAELNEYCAVSAKEYQDIERQRDDLLAAAEKAAQVLKEYHDLFMTADRWDGGGSHKPLVYQDMMKAIASVKGGAE